MSQTDLLACPHFIDGRFVPGEGNVCTSHDPARDFAPVATAQGDESAVNAAVAAARRAAPAWRRLGIEGRTAALLKVKAALPAHVEAIAQAITAEMGKPLAESRVEAASIGPKIDGVLAGLAHELPPAPADAPGEQRFHALGVMAVVGPFNFPVHLCNTHIIPALLTGNTVVVKPSDITPLSGLRYAELFAAAGLPDGVFNLVHGDGAVGAALVAHADVGGVVFTGSYATGRRIREATFDQPGKRLSLELGGKNPAVVLDDAHLEQAVREILLGALLTSGQRCTATSRVIATPGIAPALRDALAAAFARVVPDDPKLADTFMGPLATRAAFENYFKGLERLRADGAEPVVESTPTGGGAFVTPGLYAVKGDEPSLAHELFGPHVAFEVAADAADAYARAANTPFGLSASLFSANPENLEDFYDRVPAGVINFNRSTNGASGLLPFGGVGHSGNFSAAGSAAPRLCTYPVAVMQVPFGTVTPNPALEALIGKGAA